MELMVENIGNIPLILPRLDDDIHQLDKDSDVAGIQWQVSDAVASDSPGAWVDGKWTLMSDEGYPTSYLKMVVGLNPNKEFFEFVKEPSSNSFVIKNHEIENGDAIEFDVEAGGFQFSDGYLMMDEESKQYVQGDPSEGHPNWWYMDGSGTFDFILSNSGFKMRKHVDDYYAVYLVGVDADVWVYTFGESGYKQFGDFPGTQLSAIAGKSDVKGDLHFQGSDFGLWTLDVHIGYPTADHMILSYKNEYGVVANQTADMLLVPESAYYFSDIEDYYNDDASAALNFLSYAEEYRLGATDESVCNISSSNAALIVNKYNHLSDDQREIYVDTTTVNTHKRDGSEGKEYVSYRVVMEQIALIAGVNLAGSGRTISSPITVGTTTDPTTLIAVVSIVAVISLSSVAVLLVLKKRKHQ